MYGILKKFISFCILYTFFAILDRFVPILSKISTANYNEVDILHQHEILFKISTNMTRLPIIDQILGRYSWFEIYKNFKRQ